MFLEILIFLVGIVMLIMGANVMVDSASTLAQKFKIPNIVIGLTIVSMGAAMPELIVSLMASSKKNSDIVFGSIVGSNIFNILVVLGITAIILPLAVKRKTTWIEIPLSLLSAVAILIMANPMIIDGANKNVVTRTDGLIMIMFFFLFFAYIIGLAFE